METIAYLYQQGSDKIFPGVTQGMDSIGIETIEGEEVIVLRSGSKQAAGRFLEIQTGGDIRARNSETPMTNRDGTGVVLLNDVNRDKKLQAIDDKVGELVAENGS